MSKHTQGPLQVLDHPQDGVFVLDAGSRTLAKVTYLLDPAERMANAHLFAAAPDLLEALREMVEGDADAIQEAEALGVPFPPEMLSSYNKARAAIAKATGEQA